MKCQQRLERKTFLATASEHVFVSERARKKGQHRRPGDRCTTQQDTTRHGTTPRDAIEGAYRVGHLTLCSTVVMNKWDTPTHHLVNSCHGQMVFHVWIGHSNSRSRQYASQLDPQSLQLHDSEVLKPWSVVQTRHAKCCSPSARNTVGPPVRY